MKKIAQVTPPGAVKLTPAEMNKIAFAGGKHSPLKTS